jgi:iron-sulfur cluster assembly protein
MYRNHGHVAVVLVLLLAVTNGCGGVKDYETADEFGEFTLWYFNSSLTYGRPPESLEELRKWTKGIDPFPEALGRALQDVEDGRYVALWRVSLDDRSADGEKPDLGEIILIYEKDTPADGGRVGLADGSVKHMSAVEFAAALRRCKQLTGKEELPEQGHNDASGQGRRAARDGILLSEDAARVVARTLKKQGLPPETPLRVSVERTTCEWKYDLVFDPKPDPNSDIEYKCHGIRIVVDPQNLPLLRGTAISFEENLPFGSGAGFVFDNPNAPGKPTGSRR